MGEEPTGGQRPIRRVVTLGDGTNLALRLMTPADAHRVHAFARALPEDDLMFLRTDITKAVVVMLWGQNIKNGLTVTVLAERGNEVVGYASMHHNEVTWQRHLGELRIVVAAPFRSLGLGKELACEIFGIAREMGLRKIVGHMTPDQKAAIAMVTRHGFKLEAVLHDFVIDRAGRTHDLMVMTCDVEAMPTPPG